MIEIYVNSSYIKREGTDSSNLGLDLIQNKTGDSEDTLPQQIIFVQIALIALNCFNYQNARGHEFGGYIKIPLGERSS